MDVGPIPQSKVREYAHRHRLGSLFVRQIAELDRTYLAGRSSKSEAAA